MNPDGLSIFSELDISSLKKLLYYSRGIKTESMKTVMSKLNNKVVNELYLKSHMVNSGKFFNYILDHTWENLRTM